MAHLLTGDEKCRDLIYDDDYRSYLMARSRSADGYRFGRIHGKPLRAGAGAAFGRLSHFLKSMIEAIASAKLRRMERELELRGIRFKRGSVARATRNSDRTGVRED
jgi:hypothetical protein